MKSATLFRWIAVAFVTVAVVAQTSTSQKNESPNSGLKITGFNFEAKSSSRLELVPVQSAGSGTVPTAPANYGAEYRGEPTKNSSACDQRYGTRSGSDLVAAALDQVATAPRTVPRRAVEVAPI
ncbi:MAG: hypothetical protein JST84_07675 [Acidobacteria bacterium]|nr:hypothetical protein [Acidobacteriota bacterium]